MKKTFKNISIFELEEVARIFNFDRWYYDSEKKEGVVIQNEVVSIMEKHFGPELKNCGSESANGREVTITNQHIIDLCEDLCKNEEDEV